MKKKRLLIIIAVIVGVFILRAEGGLSCTRCVARFDVSAAFIQVV